MRGVVQGMARVVGERLAASPKISRHASAALIVSPPGHFMPTRSLTGEVCCSCYCDIKIFVLSAM